MSGRIVPEACSPNFSSAGAIDYRDLQAGSLAPGHSTLLSRKSLGIRLTCAMPTSLGIRLLDNRSAVAAAGGMMKTSLRPGMAHDERFFGLSDDQGISMGAYVLRFEAGKNVAAPDLELSTDDGAWRSRKEGMLLKDTLYTWSVDGRAPARLQQMDASLSVQPIIEGAAAGALTDEVPLEGSTTLELVYF